MAPSAFLKHSPECGNVFYTLAFLRTYLPTSPGLWTNGLPVAHLWSLNVEEHCYIFLSIVTLITPLRGREGPALVLSALRPS